MSVHSEAEPPATDTSSESGTEAASSRQIDDLRAAVAAVNGELKALGETVSTLLAAVEALGPARTIRANPAKSAQAAAAATDTDDSEVITVTVSPLPELAMAAVAETTLRSLPGVRQVTTVKREGNWARFTLGVSPGTDLVSEMRASMPVAFKVTDSNPGAISLTLQWAWGTT